MTKLSSPAVSSDRIELMQTFVRIVQAGSLSAAATQMGTTQPTISRRLQQLERSLGLRLLQRSTHAMKLTEDGERCYERARELLAGWEAFETDLRAASSEVSGSLRVIVPHAFGQKQLIGPLAEFMRRYPGITIEWILHDRGSDFITQGIDCAIQVGETNDPSVVAIKLAEVPRMMVASPALLARYGMPQHARDLTVLPWVAIPTFYRREVLLTHSATGEQCHVAIQPQLSSDSLYALSNAAVEGLGVCLGSSWLMEEHLASGRLVQLLPEWQAAPLPVSIIYPYARFYPARLRHFIDTMRQAMPGSVSGAVSWRRA
ncbi:LysR family transcriptional regulator [uncultured Oxalicibacterium sp.]|uniref:LysR family transcriptional regulator n=1 Tax=uncultured Oxalicibacterium sp. TaxID=1168540 RepID=UPI0025EFB346|nr:LysR family transcriptional regulator [uncultured Oxalicibacterium sp.]